MVISPSPKPSRFHPRGSIITVGRDPRLLPGKVLDMIRLLCLGTLLPVLFGTGDAHAGTTPASLDPRDFGLGADQEVVAVSRKPAAGSERVYVKYRRKGGKGEVRSLFLGGGRPRPEPEEAPSASRISAGLGRKLSDAKPDEAIGVRVGISMSNVSVGAETEVGQFPGAGARWSVNGVPHDDKALAAHNDARFRKRLRLLRSREETVRSNLKKLRAAFPFVASDGFSRALESGVPHFTLGLRPEQIKVLAGVDGMVAALEEAAGMKETVVSAMAATGISNVIQNPWGQGEGIGLFTGEPTCPDPGYLANYHRWGGYRGTHSEFVLSVARAVSPKSFLYCDAGWMTPHVSRIGGFEGNPRINIASFSAGFPDGVGLYDSPCAIVDDFIYDASIPYVVGAGNDGESAQPWVLSPALAFNVLAVGAYDESTLGVAGFSSYGNPETGIEKPEITAPGVDVMVGSHSGNGTSLSAPQVSGILADKMGIYGALVDRPALAKAWMIAEATDNISGSMDRVGEGGIHWNWNAPYLFWMESSNVNWSFIESNDPIPNNGAMDFQAAVSQPGTYRAVLSWLVRGTYTHANREADHPIGIDFDFTVLDPSGNWVGASASWDDNYETVEFTVPAAGVYTYRVNRYANRDASCDTRIGIVVVKKD